MSTFGSPASPDDPALDALCASIAELAPALEEDGAWPGQQLALCGNAGVLEWFIPRRWGGQEWSEIDLLRAYMRLSAACLTTTFVLTQLTGACQRIVACGKEDLQAELLGDLARGTRLATLGISHLTTSRRHLKQPVMRATLQGDDLILDGYSPWVTGADRCQFVVTGATLDDGRQVLVVLPTDLEGVSVDEPARLVALSASRTARVNCSNVVVDSRWLMAGPVENVMQQGIGGATGGLQTSALALGLSTAAINMLYDEATRRAELASAADALVRQVQELTAQLLTHAESPRPGGAEQLRTRANSLALRATQAALAAVKGAGYVVGHPAGRWCREALFFLVWSCPQGVMAANLCELADAGR